MKKCFSLMFSALICAMTSFAQMPVEGVSFMAEGYEADDMELGSVNATIHITLDAYNAAAGYEPYLMIATGGGFEVGDAYHLLTLTKSEE